MYQLNFQLVKEYGWMIFVSGYFEKHFEYSRIQMRPSNGKNNEFDELVIDMNWGNLELTKLPT